MRILLGAMLAIGCLTSLPAQAETWPSRPVHLIVPYPPGGNVDTAARLISDKLHDVLGQTFIVENKAGAGGLIAGEMFKKSKPDGYTVFIGANGPVLYAPIIAGREDAYSWRKDFLPITTVSMTPMVLEVYPALDAKSFADFLKLARNEAGKLNMASPGVGTSNHLLSELMQSELGVKWATVQFRGNAPATNALIAGQVQFAFDQVSVALPFIKAEKVRPLAVTSPNRTPWLPDVPTLTELGYKDFDAQTFTGLFLPAGTPKDIQDKLYEAAAKVLKDPEIAARFEQIGATATVMSPSEFKVYLEREDHKWIPIIRRIGIKAQ